MFIAERQRYWLEHGRSRPVYPVMQFVGNRLEIGAGTVLARLVDDPKQGRVLDLAGRETRILALLAAAYQRPVSSQVLDYIRRAAKEWVRGDACLAQIHLALTGLPRLEAPEEAAYRLFMAEGLMDEGTPPRDILRALDLDPAPIDRIDKIYYQAELRVPKGSGRPSGEWTIGGALGTMAVTAESFVTRNITAEALAALARFAATLPDPVAVLGLAFIPSETGTPITGGDLPGQSDLHYTWNQDEGSLLFTSTLGGMPCIVGEAHLGFDGVFYSDDHHPVARDLGGHLVIDLAAVTAHVGISTGTENTGLDQALLAPLVTTRTADEPKLCPDPGPDNPGWVGNSLRAKAYQTRVTGLLPGIAVTLNGVVFDGCREEDGTMLEAKGPGYASFIDKTGNWRTWYKKRWDLERQLWRQSRAAGSRRVEWHVAEEKTADAIRAMVGELNLSNIDVIWDP